MFSVEDLKFSNSEPAKIIAEIGINHSGELDVAKKMAYLAVSNGADIIKHQTHIPLAEMSREAETVAPGNDPRSIFAIIDECSLSFEEEIELAQFVRGLGVPFLSTPFSREAVDFLDSSIGVAAFKVGSGECNNFPFVDYVASKGKPIILSTGMNSLSTVRKSVKILVENEITFSLMHTTNLYPTPSHLLRLGGISELRDNFPGTEIGLSDHSLSNTACLAAAALGATFVERHFTDTKDRFGPDIVCSMDPPELSSLRKQLDELHLASGGTKSLSKEEEVTARFAFASVASMRDIEAGEFFTSENIFPVRPFGGEFGPEEYPEILGKKALEFIPSRTQISSAMLEVPDR